MKALIMKLVFTFVYHAIEEYIDCHSMYKNCSKRQMGFFISCTQLKRRKQKYVQVIGSIICGSFFCYSEHSFFLPTAFFKLPNISKRLQFYTEVLSLSLNKGRTSEV